jgi:hypothetical protein
MQKAFGSRKNVKMFGGCLATRSMLIFLFSIFTPFSWGRKQFMKHSDRMDNNIMRHTERFPCISIAEPFFSHSFGAFDAG